MATAVVKEAGAEERGEGRGGRGICVWWGFWCGVRGYAGKGGAALKESTHGPDTGAGGYEDEGGGRVGGEVEVCFVGAEGAADFLAGDAASEEG